MTYVKSLKKPALTELLRIREKGRGSDILLQELTIPFHKEMTDASVQ